MITIEKLRIVTVGQPKDPRQEKYEAERKTHTAQWFKDNPQLTRAAADRADRRGPTSASGNHRVERASEASE